MTREEFLRALRAELSNSVSEERIREQLSYYQDYIASECKKGRSEEEVVSELGEPRLLAKTIADAAEAGGDRIARETPFRHEESEINYNSDEEDRQYRGIDSDPGPQPGASEERERGEEWREENAEERGPRIQSFQLNNFGCFFLFLFVLLLLFLLAQLIGGIFSLLSPILLPLCAVFLLLWLLKGLMDR